MAATPLFEITDLGLAAASVANPQGPYIHITGFQVGSAYGYTPQRSDPGLNGTLLYQGVPLSYSYVGNNTIDILCQIPPDAGPFDFGEVGLFLDGGIMFAKAVFDTPQTKYSALGTNVVSTYSFHCLLKLQQSVAVFQVNTASGIPPAVWEVDQWSDVYPAGVSANPEIPLILVRELDSSGDSTLLQNTSDSFWSVGTSYQAVNNAATVANSSTTWVEFAASVFHPNALTAVNREWVLETSDGFFRSVQTIAASGANYRLTLNCSNDGTYNNTPLMSPPSVGSHCRLYSCTQNGQKIFYSQIVDAPTGAALATVGNPGLAYGGSGLYMPAAGIIEAHGLLHGPSGGGTLAGAGRRLTSADNMNDTTLVSGVYVTAVGATGLPANWPAPGWDGIMQIVNYGTITQTYYPEGMGGGDGSGNGGYPIYYRSYDNALSNWSAWFPVFMPGKQGVAGTVWTTSNLQPLTQNGIGYVAFIVLNGDSSQSKPEGTLMTLPGRPGTWMSNSYNGPIAAAADYWSVWTRVA